MNINKILSFVEKNTNSAFFYTPSIFKNAESYLLKKPLIKLSAKDETEIEYVLAQVDKYSSDKNLIGIGIIPYEIGYRFLPAKFNYKPSEKDIEMEFLFYDRSELKVIKSKELDFSDINSDYFEQNEESDYKLSLSQSDYIKAIEIIKNNILLGNTYQINFTAKIKSVLTTSLNYKFLHGIFNQSAEYTAFINLQNKYIMSFSPELFFETDYKYINCKPMKGTLARGFTNSEDERLKRFLSNDEKNIAENVMILDLLRNDIGKISKIDSVKALNKFEVEKYETLLQMTSTVQGKLLNSSLSNIIKNLFPCGSITGAPKIRSTEIISKLEKEKRGIYTGSIGLITNKKAVFNIAIRTLDIKKKTNNCEFGLGSGIVWDSDAKSEYEEVLLKGKFITEQKIYFELLESILFENGEYFLLELHMQRLEDAAEYFLFEYDRDKILLSLNELSTSFDKSKKYKARLLLNKWGNIKIFFEEIFNITTKMNVLLVQREEIKEKQFYNFKTTYRPWDKIFHSAIKKGYNDILFYNENKEILESAIGNILFKSKNKLYTPPLSLNILNGCQRQNINNKNVLIEKKIKLSNLKSVDEVIICNSIRKEIFVDEIYNDSKKMIYSRNRK